MYAIIRAGGRQVRVEPGTTIRVDRLAGEPGQRVTIDDVLLLGRDGGEVVAGTPRVAGARVIGVIEGEVRGPKIRVYKKKRRKGYERTRGHRAIFTRVRIEEIVG
ncbi:MAG TPA: 50S ribosomal protein L21 [Vicinamibacterales bacterium]|nr:50S ribosomal protein L21 [Vicinamibacterales bacterium]